MIQSVLYFFLWIFIATAAMFIIQEIGKYLGLSRMSMPFLIGAIISNNRRIIEISGFIIYMLGGCFFGFIYLLIFAGLQQTGWWIGGLIGLFHGLFVFLVILPLMPFFHPHMTSIYDGPQLTRRIEPPGFLGLNYGRTTPLMYLIAHTLYGTILGAAFNINQL